MKEKMFEKVFYKMFDKMFFGIIGTFSIVIASIPICNFYVLPFIRHKEIMDKIDTSDKRTEKIEK